MSAQCRYNSRSTSHIAILATELHKRSSLKADVNSTIFDPIPSAASLSDPAFAQVLALTDYTIASTSLHAETDGDSLCGDSSVDPTTEVSQQLQCEMKDRKGTASLAKKFSFLAYKLQRVTAIGALSSATNQETVQGQLNRYISELTEVDLDIEIGINYSCINSGHKE